MRSIFDKVQLRATIVIALRNKFNFYNSSAQNIRIMAALENLNKGDAPSLALVHPTEAEKQIQFCLNSNEWRGALSPQAYLQREATLSQQDLTRDGGISYWILVDTSLPNNPLDPDSDTRLPLASCETYRKKALVWQNGELKEVICHGIGSVFCANHLRKRGYAQRLMTELAKELRTYQTDERTECLFSVLFSDIGKVSNTHNLTCDYLLTWTEILQHFWLGAFPFLACFPPLRQSWNQGRPARRPATVRGRP
jgi:hypothetical protein